jgi:hypothetical protein
MITIAESGADGVACDFDADVQGCVTVIATIDVTGRRLPLWVICREMRIQCEADLRQHFAQEILAGKPVLTHQENG